MININTCFLKSKKQITLKRELTHTKSAKMVGDASENKFYINFGAHKEKKNDCQRREREKKKNETTAKKYATDGEGSIWIYIFSKAMITGYIHLTFRRKKREER